MKFIEETDKKSIDELIKFVEEIQRHEIESRIIYGVYTIYPGNG
jgi:hypothetical protein